MEPLLKKCIEISREYATFIITDLYNWRITVNFERGYDLHRIAQFGIVVNSTKYTQYLNLRKHNAAKKIQRWWMTYDLPNNFNILEVTI